MSVPGKLLTDRDGGNARLRVDPGQTGFFAGKFFRSYLEAVIPVAGPSVQARFTCPVNFILWSQSLTLTQGALRCEVFTSPATVTGTWSPVPAGVVGVNRMTERLLPVYAPQAVLEFGNGSGNFTGGTAVDLMMVRTASQNGQSSNVGSDQSERGLPPGTYYVRFSTITGGLTVNDAAQMLYALEWEERP